MKNQTIILLICITIAGIIVIFQWYKSLEKHFSLKKIFNLRKELKKIKMKKFKQEDISEDGIYICWAVFYMAFTYTLLGGGIKILILILSTYTVSIAIALSPLGEALLRIINGVRKLETKKEKIYLIPIFEEVYRQAKETYPSLNKNIRIHIIDSMTINACAIGYKTVAVTKGAVETLSEEELQGFIAHELGHIYNGDTKATMLTTIGNGIFAIYVIIFQIFLTALEIGSILEKSGIVFFLITIIKLIINIFLMIFMYLGQVIISINSRNNELMADEFAYSIGYGDELVEGLYLLQDMTISSNANLYEKMKASHPHIAKRIGRLERIIDGKMKRTFYLVGNI